MGWQYKEGELNSLNDKDKFMNHIMHFLNTKNYKKTTYKYALFKSILDNLFNINDSLVLSFDYIIYSFSKIYWNLVSKYKLPQQIPSSQGDLSSMEIIIYSIISKNILLDGIDFDSLDKMIIDEYISLTKKHVTKYVIGALYSEFSGVIYGFSKEERILVFSQQSYDFLASNKSVLERLNYYSWIIWIEKVMESRNVSSSNIGIKLDESTKRNNLTSFKKKLLSFTASPTCFYCGRNLFGKTIHIDHFVP